MLHINLLGTAEIYLDSPPALRFRTRKAQALLFYLAVTGRSWSRDSLATLFWPETDDNSARKNLRDILPTLRRQLDGYLLLDDEIIGLDLTSPYKCDASQFSVVLEGPLSKIATDTLTSALALYRGEFLDGYVTSRISADFELWALRERERLHQLALMGFTTLCRRQQESGAYESALATNRQLLKLAPWDEAAHRQQMLLLAQSGQPAAALAHFAICRQILADELDVEPAAETTELYQQIQAGAYNKTLPPSDTEPAAARRIASSPVEASDVKQAAPPHNLPAPLVAFVGRQSEVATTQQRLCQPDCRLLTIIGPGGMGKSSLALAVGRQLLGSAQPAFPDGIFWVPLADVNLADQASSPQAPEEDAAAGEAVLRAIAEQLNTQSHIKLSSTKQLLTYLQPRRMLLILDNFEHLVAGIHALVTLLTQAPQVRILITSRTRLNIRGENLLVLKNLSLATPEDRTATRITRATPAPTTAHVAWQASEAIAMFVQRARQFDPNFAITDETITPVDQICRLVEGLPLGIELATSMLPLLNCHELAVELAASLEVLAADARDIPHEQRTLRAVFERSWRLLAPEEQQLLARLAIFPGSFQRTAATEIAGASLTGLRRLLDQSLVNMTDMNRYTLHRTIHAFAHQKLLEQPEQIPILQRKYADFYLTFLAEKEAGLLGATYGSTVEQIRVDLDNIHAAWRRAVAHQMIHELGRCLNAMIWFYEQQGFFLDAIELCNQALDAMRPVYTAQQSKSGSAITLLVGRLQMLWGVWTLRLGRLQQAQEAYALSCTILQEVDDAAAMAYALGFWGASLRVSDPQRSRTLMTEALHLAQATETIWMQAIVYQLLGEDSLFSGNYAEAEANIKASQSLTAQIHWARGLTADHKILGRICLARGNFRQAEEHLQKSIEIARHHHLNQFYLVSLIMLGEACRLQGRYNDAQTRYAESRALAEALGGGLLLSPILWEEGTLAVQCKDYKRAKRLFTESLAMGLPNWWVHALPTLGWALIGLGELAEAQTYFQSVLVDAQAKGRAPIYLEAQAGLAYLAVCQAESDPENESQYHETFTSTLATLQQIRQHPAATQQTRSQIDQLIAQITLVR